MLLANVGTVKFQTGREERYATLVRLASALLPKVISISALPELWNSEY
jgi:hypothetical protein